MCSSLFVIWKITWYMTISVFPSPCHRGRFKGKLLLLILTYGWFLTLRDQAMMLSECRGPFCLSSTLLCKVVSYSYNILTVSKVWVFLLDGWRHDQDNQPAGGILVQITVPVKVICSHPTDGWQAAVERTSPYSPICLCLRWVALSFWFTVSSSAK